MEEFVNRLVSPAIDLLFGVGAFLLVGGFVLTVTVCIEKAISKLRKVT